MKGKFNKWVIIIFVILCSYAAFIQFFVVFNNVFVNYLEGYQEKSVVINLNIVLSFLFFLILLAAAILFGKRKKIGWILLAGCVVIEIIRLVRKAIYKYVDMSWKMDFIISGNDDYEMVRRVTKSFYLGSLQMIFLIAIACGASGFIFRKSLREIYGVDTHTMLLTICIATLVILLFLPEAIFS